MAEKKKVSPPEPQLVPPTQLPTWKAPEYPVTYALAMVLLETGGVVKRGVNKQQQFAFISFDDILRELRPALSRWGVVIVPHVLSMERSERVTKSGTTLYVVHAHVSYAIHGPGGDMVAGDSHGEGTDAGDKATGKALTNAFKNFLKELFLVAEADQDEASPEESKPQAAPRTERVARIERIAAMLGEIYEGDTDEIKKDLAARVKDYTGSLNDVLDKELAELDASVALDLETYRGARAELATNEEGNDE